MKKIILMVLCLTLTFGAAAQSGKKTKNTQSADILLPGWCCKSLVPTIENTLAYESGVVSWTLDQASKTVTVVYYNSKTNPDKIEKALSKNGILTEHYKAHPRGLKKLPKCCQPSNSGEKDATCH